jgi:hypothetical protein
MRRHRADGRGRMTLSSVLPQTGAVASDAGLLDLLSEFIDANADTVDLMTGKHRTELEWSAHCDYLRALQRLGHETVARHDQGMPAPPFALALASELNSALTRGWTAALLIFRSPVRAAQTLHPASIGQRRVPNRARRAELVGIAPTGDAPGLEQLEGLLGTEARHEVDRAAHGKRLADLVHQAADVVDGQVGERPRAVVIMALRLQSTADRERSVDHGPLGAAGGECRIAASTGRQRNSNAGRAGRRASGPQLANSRSAGNQPLRPVVLS